MALIDKGSEVEALLLSWWLLDEGMTPATMIGGGLADAFVPSGAGKPIVVSEPL